MEKCDIEVGNINMSGIDCKVNGKSPAYFCVKRRNMAGNLLEAGNQATAVMIYMMPDENRIGQLDSSGWCGDRKL